MLADVARGVLAIGALLLPAFVILGPFGRLFGALNTRVACALVCGIVGGMTLPVRRVHRLARACLGVLVAVGLVGLANPLRVFVGYPFSLTWSEGNHIWASSLYFGRVRYDVPGRWAIPGYATSGLYALEGLPFLLPHVGIQWIRLWNETLLVVPPLCLALLAFSSPRLHDRPTRRYFLVAWGFLFLLQPQGYAPLILSAIILFAAYARNRLRTLALLSALSTFYLGISRWFWMAGPPIWALTFLLFDRDEGPTAQASRSFLTRALTVIVASGLGFAAAVAWAAMVEHRSLFLYMTTLRHPMLWSRLLPNATSPYGILPWALVAVAPIGLLLLWLCWKAFAGGGLWRVGALGLFVAVFLIMGLVASVKMGGGDNLHNLDLLFVYLVILAALIAQSPAADEVTRTRAWPPAIYPLVAAALVLPMLHVLMIAGPLQVPPREVASDSLQRIANEVQQATSRGPVLFIDQRQLLTFGFIRRVPLVMEHELVDLMDRAIAGDQSGLQQFYAELETQRYSLIVSDPLPVVWRGSVYPFGEENDVWVERVTLPILQWYEPVEALDAVGVWLLRPRQVSTGGSAP